MQGASLQSYDFTITAGQSLPLLVSGNYFLIKSSTGALDVRGDFGQAKALIAGQGINGREFTKLELENKSGATISGMILVEAGAKNGNGFFDMNLILSGSTIQRPEDKTGSYIDVTQVLTATPLTIFTPAQNPNGTVLLSAGMADYVALGCIQAFIAKSSAPTGITDGEIILATVVGSLNGSSAPIFNTLPMAQKISAGLGLYFYTSTTGGANNVQNRYARFKAL